MLILLSVLCVTLSGILDTERAVVFGIVADIVLLVNFDDLFEDIVLADVLDVVPPEPKRRHCQFTCRA